MQIDMHYYGTFVLCRAAGIREEIAVVIATASQFVDDSVETVGGCVFRDGSRLKQTVTAHHTLSVANISRDDQKLVWVPFHFLPGNSENADDPLKKKLICRRNSLIARQLFDNALANSGSEHGAELIGIASHVFMDTFSHCGFSGVSSKYNEIKNRSISLINYEQFPDHIKKYIGEKLERTITKKISWIAALLRRFFSFTAENISKGLGHGAVASFPDIPFLKWNFTFEDKRPGYAPGDEDNSIRFLEGCELLFNYYRRYISSSSSAAGSRTGAISGFHEIKNDIHGILMHPGNKEDRIKKWQEFYTGSKTINPRGAEIPEYDPGQWIGNLDEICGRGTLDDVNKNLRNFYSAAEYHRWYVLNELLPGHGIHVI